MLFAHARVKIKYIDVRIKNMKFNAVLVKADGDVLKVHVEFDSELQGLKDAIEARGLTTIHTRDSQEVSHKMGVHLMGYVDKYMERSDKGNNYAACRFSGYDYLASDMIVIKTDDKFNALPLEEDEVECVYIYFTTNRIVRAIPSELVPFARKYETRPALPNFPIKPSVRFVDGKPNLAFVIYDFRNASDDEIETAGGELFYFADYLLNNYIEVDGKNSLSPDKKHHLMCQNVYNLTYYVIGIQAINNPSEPLIIDDVLDFIDLEKEEEEFDLSDIENLLRENGMLDDEGEYPEEIGGNKELLLEVEFEGRWPKHKQNNRSVAKYVIMISDSDEPVIPLFNHAFKILNVDESSREITFTANLGKGPIKYTLHPNESVEIEFDYISRPSVSSSYRVGKMKITARDVIMMDNGKMDGSVYFKTTGYCCDDQEYLEELEDVFKYPMIIKDKREQTSYNGVLFYSLQYVSKDSKYAILFGSVLGEEINEDNPVFMVPVEFGKPTIFEEEFTGDDGKRYINREVIEIK